MNFVKTKSTKRFDYTVERNTISKKAGSNIVTIATRPEESGQYSLGHTNLTMTVREAKALNSFLTATLAIAPVSEMPVV